MKNRLQVEIKDYEDFTEEEQNNWCSSNNGCGKEYADYLVVKYDNEIIFVESNAIEPEDVSFHRDLCSIPDIILKAYELGKGETNK